MRRRALGLTLLELLVAITILAILGTIALPSYHEHVEAACVAQTQTEMRDLEAQIERYYTERQRYPNDLTEARLDQRRDCWGQPFRYLNFSGVNGFGSARKDRYENPLNSDFDLYSVGADGESSASLRPPISHDDVIRARNGAYVGLADNY